MFIEFILIWIILHSYDHIISLLLSREVINSNPKANCSEVLENNFIDMYPIRGPVALHDFVAAKSINKSIVEIGIRKGDSITCFSHYASKTTGIEMNLGDCAYAKSRTKSPNVDILCGKWPQTNALGDLYFVWIWAPYIPEVWNGFVELFHQGQMNDNAEVLWWWDYIDDDVHHLYKYATSHYVIPFDESNRPNLCDRYATGETGTIKIHGFTKESFKFKI